MSASTILSVPHGQGVVRPAPPLEPGDRLTRAEFERRYSGMARVKKAELVEGIVYMPSPVRLKKHARPHAEIMGWLYQYSIRTPGSELADNPTLRLDLENEPQPDAVLRIVPEAGGQTRDTEDDYIEGAPELVAEIVSSSASYDLHEKKRAYRRNGVREYLAWVVDEERIEWWHLDKDEYVALPSENGIFKSRVFPGLWLDANALLTGHSQDVLARVQEGLSSPEHSAFVQKLGGHSAP